MGGGRESTRRRNGAPRRPAARAYWDIVASPHATLSSLSEAVMALRSSPNHSAGYARGARAGTGLFVGLLLTACADGESAARARGIQTMDRVRTTTREVGASDMRLQVRAWVTSQASQSLGDLTGDTTSTSMAVEACVRGVLPRLAPPVDTAALRVACATAQRP